MTANTNPKVFMDLISYEEFSQLRLRQFFGPDVSIHEEESGVQTVCGLGGCEEVGFTNFSWPQNEPHRVAGIDLMFGEGDCPPEIAKAILARVGLPLVPDMPKDEVLKLMGTPELTNDYPTGVVFFRFLCGRAWPYYVGCSFQNDKLISVKVFKAIATARR